MKILIVSLALLLAATSPAASQIFGKKKSQAAPASDAKIDSLTLANEALTLKTDSLSTELAKYFGVYAVLKGKVIHYNFDPSKTSVLIDSVKASKGMATAAFIPVGSGASSDSLASMYRQTVILKANIDTMKVALDRIKSAIPQGELDRVKAISSLKQYKDLLDAKVITDEEYLSLKKKCLSNL